MKRERESVRDSIRDEGRVIFVNTDGVKRALIKSGAWPRVNERKRAVALMRSTYHPDIYHARIIIFFSPMHSLNHLRPFD